MIKIALSGFGKMNRDVLAVINEQQDMKVVSILRQSIDQDEPALNKSIKIFTDPRKAFEMCNVVIDFSTSSSAVESAMIACQMGKSIVIGTTGISNDELEKIRKTVSKNKTSAVISPNFSIGVNIFMQASEFLTKKLDKYSIEMIDIHHKAKKDAPSGTALKTATKIKAKLDRMGRKMEIPIHSLRMGDVIGDHAVVYAGNNERIELWHKATSRRCFAQGAVLSARFLSNKKDGVIHEFSDVL